nr:alpha/beta fold hydrolase [Streptomyces sp. 846.5]
MRKRSKTAQFCSLDGLNLAGTVEAPVDTTSATAVLVHGGGITREEGGFFTRLADGLADAGGASLRFDLRGHGESEGRQEDLTLSGIANDIRAALDQPEASTLGVPLFLLGASFSGGISAYVATQEPPRLRGLVLINPLLNYKKRFIDEKPYWHDDHLDAAAGAELAAQGYLSHSSTFKLGRPLLKRSSTLTAPSRATPRYTHPHRPRHSRHLHPGGELTPVRQGHPDRRRAA